MAIIGAAIVLLSVWFTNSLTTRLEKEEQNKVRLYFLALEMTTNADDEQLNNCDFTLHGEVINANTTIPIILVDDAGAVMEGRNFGEQRDTNILFLQQELATIKRYGHKPLEGVGYARYIYYKESRILTLLKYLPYIQFLLIAAFIAIGYIGFSATRRAEQNRVWVGMAKETAHQLGTPISAMMAWIEHLRSFKPDDADTMMVVDELNKDVDRLRLVAERFSKIGSTPELERVNIYEQLEKCRNYMQKRAPRKVTFDFPEEADYQPIYVSINAPLFDWVIENLLRNALDALDGKGEILANVYRIDDEMVAIDISDTGKGIPANKFKTVFEPGYTTKKRGWGLGLSLAKRIIESYHNGKIFVKKSTANEGTTFTIRLPEHHSN